MRIDSIKLDNQNVLINDYRNNRESIMEHFDYAPYSQSTYEDRASELKSRNFGREELVEVLIKLNKQWDAPDSTYLNIERLEKDNSMVVIGGQQAGLLTGPMYTINKIISIIQFAKEQEEKLNTPVIPVFWIAGEDHDFDEVNHIFLPEKESMKKYKLLQRVKDKQPLSDIPVDETYAKQWVDSLFEQLNESQYTKDLYQTIKNCLSLSDTYVDFFARLLLKLFKDEGLVLFDSGSPEARKIESNHFLGLIENQHSISQGVYTTLQQVKQKGYSVSLEVDYNDGHLFYHKNKERILLVRNEDGSWAGKQNEVLLSEQELTEIAKSKPELLSNNVVTRPVMQDLLFPTLAFIGGPGEVGYWSALKPAFHTAGIKMPPVIPRLSFTFVDRNADKILNRFAIDPKSAVSIGVDQLKSNWLAAQNDPPVEQIANEIKSTVDKVHEPLRDVARNIRADLGELADRNLYYLHCDIEYLEDRIQKAIKEKYRKELAEYNLVGITLRPNNGLQERVWNPLIWINEYGADFIRELVNSPCSFKEDHYVVYF
ncbi:bacillithiol biosynthesis cysteine-adding enzyme BshC [Virgibacillus kekensis]|uniref:Putative cysteine ligase BshC n=1 Tax=Virgibacillus kekensis TaxID=202261 RepID=A0ABV9DDX0_9BACI